MNAMTWWDHETESIWSQPWGRAIEGQARGIELFPLPFQLTSWGNWREAHPNTLIMTNDLSRTHRQQSFNPDFVIGLLLAGESKAYYYRDVAAQQVVNDTLAGTPILVWAGESNFKAYIREVDGRTLIFRTHGEQLRDEETGSTWNVIRGLATAGPLKGQGLQPVPTASAFDWAWRDFYPDAAFYQP